MNRSIYRVFVFTAVLCFSAAMVMAKDSAASIETHDHTVEGNATLSAPELIIDFDDTIPKHNMGIASDGSYYYTCNGGDADFGQINTYDINGTFVSSVPCLIDMRSIFYSYAYGNLYAKTWENDLYQVNPATGSANLILDDIFFGPQTSPAITPDGQLLIEHENGTVYFIDFLTGALSNTLTGFYYGDPPSNGAVGTDGDRIFTWDGSLVYVYDMDGTFIESYNLPSGNYGFSLKFVNGLLFASVDGTGGTGHWYGYNVGEVALERSSWGLIKGLFQ